MDHKQLSGKHYLHAHRPPPFPPKLAARSTRLICAGNTGLTDKKLSTKSINKTGIASRIDDVTLLSIPLWGCFFLVRCLGFFSSALRRVSSFCSLNFFASSAVICAYHTSSLPCGYLFSVTWVKLDN